MYRTKLSESFPVALPLLLYTCVPCLQVKLFTSQSAGFVLEPDRYCSTAERVCPPPPAFKSPEYRVLVRRVPVVSSHFNEISTSLS